MTQQPTPSFGTVFVIVLKVIGAVLVVGLIVGLVAFSLGGGSVGVVFLLIVAVCVAGFLWARNKGREGS